MASGGGNGSSTYIGSGTYILPTNQQGAAVGGAVQQQPMNGTGGGGAYDGGYNVAATVTTTGGSMYGGSSSHQHMLPAACTTYATSAAGSQTYTSSQRDSGLQQQQLVYQQVDHVMSSIGTPQIAYQQQATSLPPSSSAGFYQAPSHRNEPQQQQQFSGTEYHQPLPQSLTYATVPQQQTFSQQPQQVQLPPQYVQQQPYMVVQNDPAFVVSDQSFARQEDNSRRQHDHVGGFSHASGLGHNTNVFHRRNSQELLARCSTGKGGQQPHGGSQDMREKPPGFWDSYFTVGVPYRLLVSGQWILPFSSAHIVGKGGRTINQISQSTSASIQVLRETYIPGLEDRIILIAGPTEDAKRVAVVEILKQLKAKLARSDADGNVGMIILVPEKAVSVVIGYKGGTINRVSKHCGCDIQVISDMHPLTSRGLTDKAISIRGPEEMNVASGVELIHDILADMFAKHKLTGTVDPALMFHGVYTESDFIFSLRPPAGDSSTRQPSAQLPTSQFSKGGSSMSQRRRQQTAADDGLAVGACVVESPVAGHVGSTGKGTTAASGQRHLRRGGDDDDQQRRVRSIEPSDLLVPAGVSTLPATLRQYPAAFLKIPHLLKEVINNTTDVVTLQLVSSKYHVAWVIGNAGIRKKEIEGLSSAVIKVHNHPPGAVTADPGDRVITIKGDPMGIGRAVNLMICGFEAQEQRLGSPLRMIIASQSVAAVAGSDYRVLDALATASGAHVKMVPAPVKSSDHSLLEITGRSTEKVSAVMLVLQKLLEALRRNLLKPLSGAARSKRQRALDPEHDHVQPLKHPYMASGRSVRRAAVTVRSVSTNRESSTARYVGRSPRTSFPPATPPEAHFIREAVHATYPKVITTADHYSICVSFANKYKTLMSGISPADREQLEAMVSMRVGGRVKMMWTLPPEPTSSVSIAAETPANPAEENDISEMIEGSGAEQLCTDIEQHHTEQHHNSRSTSDGFSDDALHFIVTGTPMSNATALLLLHETLMNLEQKTDLSHQLLSPPVQHSPSHQLQGDDVTESVKEDRGEITDDVPDDCHDDLSELIEKDTTVDLKEPQSQDCGTESLVTGTESLVTETEVEACTNNNDNSSVGREPTASSPKLSTHVNEHDSPSLITTEVLQ